MSTHEQLRRDLGSYVVGALDPGDRSRLEAHLGTCPACREELAAYAGLPGLLSRVTLDEVVNQSLLPAPALLPRLLDTVEQERQASVKRLRRWRVAAGGLAATAVATAALAVLPGPTGVEAPTSELRAAAGSPAVGAVALGPRPWGTSVELDLQGLPPAELYVAWVADDDGDRSEVASWGPTDDGSATVTGATALAPRSVRGLTVETEDGTRLLTLRR